MSKLLLDENPLLIMPKLACVIGLNESIVLQQIHYWLKLNEKVKHNSHDGYYWTYNSYKEWQEQFPFWSIKTIQRTIQSLEERKLIIVGNYNKLKIDRTKWYRIDYEVLESLENSHEDKMTSRTGQNDTTNKPKSPNQQVILTLPLPETSSEINSKTNSENNIYISFPTDDPFLFIYNGYFLMKFRKEHMKIEKKSYFELEEWITELVGNGIMKADWEKAVKTHFEKLAKGNNGNILAFMAASKRWFDVDPPHVNFMEG